MQKLQWPTFWYTISSKFEWAFLVRSPHRSSQPFQASAIRQVLHIAFEYDVDKDSGTLAKSEFQALWLPIRHSFNFSQCYKYYKAIKSRTEREKLE